MLTGETGPRQDSRFFIRPGAAAVGAALVVTAAVLRLWHLKHGLPDFLEEAIPFKKALQMWGWETGETDLNPHFFNYPTLSIYLHFLVQKFHYAAGLLAGSFTTPADYWLAYQIDPTRQVVLARMVGVLGDCVTVLAVWTIGERLRRGAGVVAGLLVAFAPTMIVTARSIYSDTVMAALAAWALFWLLAYLERSGRARLVAAVILIGLAAGAKYTAGLLVVPLAWVMWHRHRWRGLLGWVAAATGCLLVFLLSSPYVVLDFAEFWQDFSFERRHMAEGHLGTLGRRGGLFQLRTLAGDLGWPALLILAGSLLWAIWTAGRTRGRGARAEITLWLFLLPNALSVALFRMEAARYLLPILPPAALLCATAAMGLGSRWSGGRGRIGLAVVLAAVLLPPAWAGVRGAAGGADTTHSLARRWCEANLTREQLVVQEAYGAPLLTDIQVGRVQANPSFKAASDRMQDLYLSLPRYRSVNLPMAASGKFTLQTVGLDGSPLVLDVFPHASELNQVFYVPPLFAQVEYFLTSSAIRGRYEADPDRYPTQNRFYGLLDREAFVAARFASNRYVAGPDVTIYRLGKRFQEFLAGSERRLEPLWWAQAVPVEFRLEADRRLAPPELQSQGAVHLPDGKPARWVRALHFPFEYYIMPFLMPMAHHLAELGHFGQGRRYAAAVLILRPDQSLACRFFSYACTQLDDWQHARAAVENCLRILARRGESNLELSLELLRILNHLGDEERARAVLEEIRRTARAGSKAARLAERTLAGQADPPPGRDSP